MERRIGSVSDFDGAVSKLFVVGGRKIAVFKVGDDFFATDELCTHVGGPLHKGKVDDFVVTCPWHGSRFDIRTGKVVSSPAKKDIKAYAVSVKGTELFIDL